MEEINDLDINELDIPMKEVPINVQRKQTKKEQNLINRFLLIVLEMRELL